MSPAPDLSIIIPAYREADRIGATLHALAEFLRTRQYGQVEVVVMTQSADDTAAAAAHEAADHDFRVVNLGQRAGKGGAVRAGMFEARGRWRLFMDADLATPLRHLDEVKALMDKGADVGIAVRDISRTHKGLRKLLSDFGNILAQVILLPGIRDTQCGFKVFSAEAAEAVFSRQTITGWAFDMEVLLIARKLGYKIETFAADDWKDPKLEGKGLVGESSLSTALNMFKDMLRIRLMSLTGRYRRPSYHYSGPGK